MNQSDSVSIREITNPTDPAWGRWFEIYLESIPPQEQMSEDYFRQVLAGKAQGELRDARILLATKGKTNAILGIAYYQVGLCEDEVGCLWYLATTGTERNRGYGAQIYRAICAGVRERHKLMFFEVEIPELAEQRAAEGDIAARRIAWYERQGAQQLLGVRYIQSVDTTDTLLPMRLMVHKFAEMSVEEVYRLAKQLFGDGLERVSDLGLSHT